MFLYYNQRLLTGHELLDSGSSVKSALKVLQKQGVCKENMYKYIIENYDKRPPKPCYDNALIHRILKYVSVGTNIKEFKIALSTGRLIAFGFLIKETIDKMDENFLLDYVEEDKIDGGHAVVCYGYDDNYLNKGGYIKLINSWGKNWGDEGKFYMSYRYLESGLCSDAWILMTTA